MKVTDVKTFAVDCFRTNWVFVKVYTDEGIDGVGEATLEYKEKALIGAVEHIKEYLVGKNPLAIEKHWHDIYRDAYWRGGAVLMSALSAVEMALWDILGKYLNVPVYQLLGGRVNDKVRIYVNGWFAGAKEPEEFGEKAKIAVERGVTAKSVMFGISNLIFHRKYPFLKFILSGINYQGYLLRRCSGVIPITASQHHISPEHKKKSEPFAYRLWVRISTVWCGGWDLNPHDYSLAPETSASAIPPPPQGTVIYYYFSRGLSMIFARLREFFV